MILIVSDEPALLYTRAVLLSEWGCTTTGIAGAADTLTNGRFALIVFCQTVPESVAIELLAIARKFNQAVKVLTITSLGCSFDRTYESETYAVDFAAPEGLREVVARVLTPHAVTERPSISLVPPMRRSGRISMITERTLPS